MKVNEMDDIISSDDYDSWGMILNGRSSNFGFANDKYKFTGKERDVETGYYYFGARYFDSRIGRWNVIDPLFEKYPNVSPYNYALNNPLRFIDPKGMEAVKATPDDPDDKKKKQQETTIKYLEKVGNFLEKGFEIITDGVSEFISDNSNKLSSENLSDKSSDLALASTIAATCDPEPVSKTMLYSVSGFYTSLSIGFDIITTVKHPDSGNINKLVFDAFTIGTGSKISKTLKTIKSIQNDSKAIDQLFKSFWNTGTWGASHIIF